MVGGVSLLSPSRGLGNTCPTLLVHGFVPSEWGACAVEGNRSAPTGHSVYDLFNSGLPEARSMVGALGQTSPQQEMQAFRCPRGPGQCLPHSRTFRNISVGKTREEMNWKGYIYFKKKEYGDYVCKGCEKSENWINIKILKLLMSV